MIILTGAAGFIGSVTLERLSRRHGEEILIVDNLGTSEKWKNLVGKKFSRYVHRDQFLSDLTDGKLPSAITAIVHLGACSSTTERDVDFLMKNNVDYSIELARYAATKGIRFVYASSAATYGNGTHGYQDGVAKLSDLQPTNPYGFSKHVFDQWMQHEGLLNQSVGLKFFNVYGPNEYHKKGQASVAWKAFKELDQTGSVKLFRSMNPSYQDGEQKRDFVYVKDCAEVIDWLLDHPEVNGLFNLGSGKSRTWRDLVNAVAQAIGVSAKIEFIDLPENLREHYQYFTEAPMGALKAAGYSKELTSIEDGVADYVRGYLRQGRYL